MSAFDWVERFGDGLVFCAVMVGCLGLAVACAPSPPVRRMPALAKRNRVDPRY